MRRSTIFTVIAVVAIVALTGTVYFARSVPVLYADPVDHYKYGSFGSEADSMPMAIWEALPDVCPDKLPGGWAELGLVYEPGHDRPVGVSERRVGGIERMGVNCAMCHAGAVRERPGAAAMVVVGMPNHQLDFVRFVQFTLDCVADPRFTPDGVIAAMRRRRPVSGVEAILQKTFVIPKVKRLTAEKAPQFSWLASKPPSGPGRLDTPNSLKRMLGLDISADSVGTVDFPSVWNQAARRNRFVHWDANSPSLTERDHITAAIAGATTASLDSAELTRIETWLENLPPPKYPYAIDQALASRGAPIFDQQCASCHVQRSLEVTRVQLVGTDRHRLDALSAVLLTKMNSFGGSSGTAAHYRKTDGYSNVLLDGIWARAPYLHNGSVPTMADLLTPPEKRPAVFYSGSSVYDQQRMGFVSSGSGADGGSFRYDTQVTGNGNGGHAYGTTLSDDDKRALIEYLKTR
jgi:processive rubber oxygenase RoxA-like protein